MQKWGYRRQKVATGIFLIGFLQQKSHNNNTNNKNKRNKHKQIETEQNI